MEQTEPVLSGERVVVRLARMTDAGLIADFYRENDVHLSRFESPRPRRFHEGAWWETEIDRRRRAFQRDRSCRFFLFDRDGKAIGEPDAVIGTIGLSSFVRGVLQACTLGYALAERAQGRGLMHESLTLAIDFAFTTLNLHRIMANYSPRNLYSARVLERLGFTVEGYARRYLYVNGAWEDHVLTSLTNAGWKVPRGLLMVDRDGRARPVPEGEGPG